MANLGEFIFALAKDAGMDTESDQFKGFMGQTQFESLDMPSEIETGIKSGFLTIESAKNNSELHKHFKGQNLDMVDQSLSKGIRELSLPANITAEIDSEPDTNKKIVLALSKANDHFKSLKPESVNDPELEKRNKEYADKINEQHEIIGAFPAQLKEQEDKLTGEFDQERITHKMSSMISSYQFSEKTTPEFITWHINKTLNESPFVIKSDMKLYQRENTDLTAQKNNQDYQLKDFIEETISPYLQTTAPPTNAPPPGGTAPIVTPDDNRNVNSNQVEWHIGKDMPGKTKPKVIHMGAKA